MTAPGERRGWRWWLGAALLFGGMVVLLGRCASTFVHRPTWLALANRADGPDPHKARRVFVFLHGYGGSKRDIKWVIDDLRGRAGMDQVAFVAVDGPFPGLGGRTWGDNPAEYAESELRVRELVRSLAGGNPDRVVIGGFSQGAMIAFRVAATGDLAKTAVLVGGCEYAYPGVPEASVRYLFLHGIQDRICPFTAANTAADALAKQGLDAEMISFHGDHEIPDVARLEMARVLGP